MIAPVKLIYSPTIIIIGLLTAALTLLLVQFAAVLFLSQKILTTTKQQYFISSASFALNNTFIGVLDIESAVRGYVLTNDRQYLEPYFGAVAVIDSSLINLSANIFNNAEWEKQLQKIISLIKVKMEYLDGVIKLQDASDEQYLKVAIAEKVGKKTMDSIRLSYRTLDAELRSERRNIANLNQQNQWYLLWIQGVTDSLLIILIFIATCLGVKNLKSYMILNAVLNTESTTDTLTKLANLRLFLVSANLALARTNRGESDLAILFIDLNGFKKINDTFGHQTGDVVLQMVATRLKSAMRSSDFLARIGGDEFAILITGEVSKEGLTTFQKHLVNTISAPQINEVLKGVCIIANIGCATYPENGTTIETLLAAADAAMYINKKMHNTQGLATIVA
ncbi:MAG: diguanylate cyclase [Sheuella sp.]|nr:diguanylate cyclase [Sheuella sp.]